MNRRILFSLCIILTGQAGTLFGVNIVTSPDAAKDWAESLAHGQKAKDAKPLAAFLEDWRKASRPVSQETLRMKPEVEQEVYALYPAYFVPAASKEEADYLIIQSYITIHLVDGNLAEDYPKAPQDFSFERAERRATISRLTFEDFRPLIEAGKKKVLYYDNMHVDAIARFLAGKHEEFLANSYEHEYNGEKDELSGEGPFTERLAYLNGSLEVQRRLWDRGWFIETHPLINLIVLDTKRATAIIYARQYNRGILTLMQREEKGWRIVRTRDTWVE